MQEKRLYKVLKIGEYFFADHKKFKQYIFSNPIYSSNRGKENESYAKVFRNQPRVFKGLILKWFEVPHFFWNMIRREPLGYYVMNGLGVESFLILHMYRDMHKYKSVRWQSNKKRVMIDGEFVMKDYVDLYFNETDLYNCLLIYTEFDEQAARKLTDDILSISYEVREGLYRFNVRFQNT